LSRSTSLESFTLCDIQFRFSLRSVVARHRFLTTNSLSLPTKPKHSYHYHTQIFDAIVEGGNMALAGESYIVSTPGPFKCWKADLSRQAASSALSVITSDGKDDAKEAGQACCLMSDYVKAETGVVFEDGYTEGGLGDGGLGGAASYTGGVLFSAVVTTISFLALA